MQLLTHPKRLQKWLALVTGATLTWSASATTLNVPYYSQQQDNWCWDASSEMVLSFYGTDQTQVDIAAYGSEGQNVGNYLWGSSPHTTTSPALNGVNLVLRHFANLHSAHYSRALTAAELQNEIDHNRPVIIGIAWSKNKTGPFVANAGGHAVVLTGFDGTKVDVWDPWPDNGALLRDYSVLLGGAAGVYTAHSARFQWDESLTTAASLDLAILIDSTASMTDAIDDAKAEAQSIVDNVFSRFADARVAIADYRDNPDGTHGGYGDWIVRADTAFTSDTNTISAAINSIYANGGEDIPEAVYSALCEVLDGQYVGAWRPNPTPRMVVIIGDAPGHDPVEPWSGGHSLADVIAKATRPGSEINIQGIVVASYYGTFDPDAVVDFSAFSAASGGGYFNGTSSEVGTIVNDIVSKVAESERSPRDSVAAFHPRFTFALPGGGMFAQPTRYTLQILQSNSVTGTWKTFLTTSVKTNSYVPKSILPVGTYRWRLGFQQPATTALSPSGTVLYHTPAKVLYENSYTEFERQPVLPGTATLLSPPYSDFIASSSSVTYEWSAAVNASSYALCITNASTGKLFKRLTVKPPAKNPLAPTLSVKVSGHTPNIYYTWGVTGLNYDRPKP